MHPTPKGTCYHVRVDDENTDVRALLTSLGASDIHHVQKCNDDSREWCVDVTGELTGDSAVPWACFEAESDALLAPKGALGRKLAEKDGEKNSAWLAKRLGGCGSPRRASAAAAPPSRRPSARSDFALLDTSVPTSSDPTPVVFRDD